MPLGYFRELKLILFLNLKKRLIVRRTVVGNYTLIFFKNVCQRVGYKFDLRAREVCLVYQIIICIIVISLIVPVTLLNTETGKEGQCVKWWGFR